jgi:hypothetical protein
MSTIRVGNIGPLTGNTSVIADPGGAGGMSLVSLPVVNTIGGLTSYTLASGFPTWIRRVTIAFASVTCSASTNPMVQLVAGGSTVTSGYTYNASYISTGVGTTNFTTGFGIRAGAPSSGDVHHGSLILHQVSTNLWSASLAGAMYSSGNYTSVGGGWISLASSLTGLILTSSGGATTFSGGQMTVFYE